jgi:DNA-binding response OmpR family regulator
VPKVSGMEALAWIRKRLPALQMAVLTARDGVDDRVADSGLNTRNVRGLGYRLESATA